MAIMMQRIAPCDGSPRDSHLTSDALAKRAGIHYRTLLRLIERGLLKPALTEFQGNKTAYLWNSEEAFIAEIVCGLYLFGFDANRISEVVSYVREHALPFSDNIKLFLILDREPNAKPRILTGEQMLDIPALLRQGSVIIPLEVNDSLMKHISK